MQHVATEQELLDQQEALARAGIHLALRGLGIDLIDALSLPPALREHAMFDTAIAAAAGAIGHDAVMQIVGAWLLKAAPKRADLRGMLSALGSSAWLR